MNIERMAQKIDEFISSHQLEPTELDDVIKYGVPVEAVEYWREHYNKSKPVNCECGGDTANTTHSNWCPKFN